MAHVGNVEKPRRVSHGVVFLKNSPELNREFPPGKLDKPGTLGFVQRVEGGAMEGGVQDVHEMDGPVGGR
jgi:hypothetical protein